MHSFQALWQYVTTLPASSWSGLLALLIMGTGATSLVQAVKPFFKRLEKRYGVEAKKLIIASLGAVSLAISVASDYVSSNGQSLGIVGNHAAWIMSIALAIYHFGGSKTYRTIACYLNDLQVYLSTGQLPGGKPKS